MPPMDADDLLAGVRATGDVAGADPLLARLGRAARAGAPSDGGAPPAGIWDGIAAAVAAGRPVDHAALDSTVADPQRPQLTVLDGGSPAHRAQGRPNRAVALIAAAAAVVAAVGLVSVVGIPRGSDEGELVAAAALAPLAPGENAAGRAEVHQTEAVVELDVELSNLPDAATGTFYELWLIDSGVTKLISLGPVRPDGRYVLPAGLDLSAYPVVDVSVEPIDGNTLHSGASILRGTLDT